MWDKDLALKIISHLPYLATNDLFHCEIISYGLDRFSFIALPVCLKEF